MSASDILQEAMVEIDAGGEGAERISSSLDSYTASLDQSTYRLINTTASRQLVLREALVAANALEQLAANVTEGLPEIARIRGSSALVDKAIADEEAHYFEEQEPVIRLIGSLGRLLSALNTSMAALSGLVLSTKQMPNTTRQLRSAKDRAFQALRLLQEELSDAIEKGSQTLAALHRSLSR